jgi:hypothetical protein
MTTAKERFAFAHMSAGGLLHSRIKDSSFVITKSSQNLHSAFALAVCNAAVTSFCVCGTTRGKLQRILIKESTE